MTARFGSDDRLNQGADSGTRVQTHHSFRDGTCHAGDT